jgi:hypothetical protein
MLPICDQSNSITAENQMECQKNEIELENKK